MNSIEQAADCGSSALLYKTLGAENSNKSFYTIWARWPGHDRLFSVEWEMIETEAEVITVLRENRRAVLVFRHDPDVPRRDVSEDMALLWLRERVARGYDQTDLPEFIAENLSSDAIARVTHRSWPMAAE